MLQQDLTLTQFIKEPWDVRSLAEPPVPSHLLIGTQKAHLCYKQRRRQHSSQKQ